MAGEDASETAAAKIRLLVADVDGTLVTREKILTPAALAAAADLRGAGVALSITSGRPPRGMRMLIGPLQLSTPIAGFNGGVFTRPDLSVIESHTLDPAVAKAALALIEEKGLDAWVYTADDWFIRDAAAPHVAREAWTVKFEAKVVKDFTPDQLSATVKIVGVSDDEAAVAECEIAARAALGAGASAARSQPYYLDITHPSANKGAVIAWMAKRLGVAKDEIAAIGDMPNDVMMFDVAGYSIAMGQAAQEVKAKATTTTAGSEEDGFAKAVAQLLARQGKIDQKKAGS